MSATEAVQYQAAACEHCGLKFFPKSPSQKFCCHGCEFVYGLIRSHGLDEYYRLRQENPPTCPIPARVSSETYEFCDDPEFVRRASTDGRRMLFFLEGMNCSACVWLLEKLPDFCSDAESAFVNMSSSTIEVTRVEGGSFASIARALNGLGYPPHPVMDADSAKALRRRERRRDLIRIGVAAAATGNIMILAVSLYGGAEGVVATYFRWLTALLALPVLTYCAWPFYQSAFGAIRSRRLNIDVPIVAALVAGIIISLIGLWNGEDTLYFDSLSMLVFLLLSSRFWLKSVQENHLDVSHLEDELLLGTVVRLSPDGARERVSTLSLKEGDLIEISGEMNIPIDGVVVSGEGFYQVAALTGESDAEEVHVGREVEAGSRNLVGRWVMRVLRPASESRLASILRDTERSSRAKSSIILFADRVSRWFVGIVMALAVGVALYFLPTNPHEGFMRALALVIVTCPCVFGMAIPLSVSLAIRAAARNGMVIKDGNALERLTKIRRLVFDKTGTLTSGDMRVLTIAVTESNRKHLQAVASIENGQPHPVARALVKAVEELGFKPGTATDVKPLPSGGIEGRIDGRLYFIRPCAPDVKSEGFKQIKAKYELCSGDEVLAVFEIGDDIRKGAPELIEWTRKEGYSVQLLSGDRKEVVEDCARKIGLKADEAIAQATPEEKSQILKKYGISAAMIGDGANDAAALASASVGIAVRGSIDVSFRAADVYLMSENLAILPRLFKIARATRNAIRRNLVFSAGFNLLSGVLALGGYMTPLLAAVLMPTSSIIVLLSALSTGNRFMKQGGERP